MNPSERLAQEFDWEFEGDDRRRGDDERGDGRTIATASVASSGPRGERAIKWTTRWTR